MIRMIQSISASHAKAYFSQELAKADYYIEDQELNGQLQGKLAERLNITGIATRERFFALCENLNPETGEPLTQRRKSERTTGYDINFHCPKSVSILHALSKDNHILEAFHQSVKDTMKDIERDAKTRMRKKGTYDDRDTEELIWADFVHQTARPVEGFVPDPHLHAHCFVFNATWDAQEKQIKAAQFRDIKRDMPYYQARFHKQLSDRLIKLGYEVRRTEKSFEVQGVPTKVIELFSKRTDEIGRFAKENGITDSKELDALGARTRSGKQKELGMSELRTEWKKQIKEAQADEKGEASQAVRFAPEKERVALTPQQCVDHAILHGFERASVLQDRRLLESAYRHSLGNASVSIDEITKTFKQDLRIIHVKEKSKTLCTTRQVLSEEQHMIKLAREGQGKLVPLYREAPALSLEGQQADAVSHILTTPNRVSIVRGAAGSGKTTLMREAVDMIEKAGKKVTVVAPSAQASRNVLRQEGFENAETVSKLLVDKKMQEGLENQVLWVDEAGLLGTREMNSLLELATKQNTRLVLGGDTRQHSSVIRGDALRILNTVGGINTAEVNKIYRQRDEHYRKVVEDLSQGDVKEAFEKLDVIGSIKDVDPSKPNDNLVSDYTDALRAGKSALVVSPTHQHGEEVTGAIRSKLKSAGLLGKKELSATRLINLNLTEAQKADWRNFEKGQLIQFNQNLPGVKRGSTWTVADSSEKVVNIKALEGGFSIPLPLQKSDRYDVFSKGEIRVSKGDKLNITRNSFDQDKKRLNNGQSLEVVSVHKKGEIVLRNAESKATYKLNKDFGHLSHAYCVTSHASQGKTVDEVMISQPASTFPATDAKQFYVSVSRARDRVHIYTDDKEQLLEYASEMRERQSAMELVLNSSKTTDMIHHQIRENVNRQEPEKEKTVSKDGPSRNKYEDYEPGI